jgi:3-polyprenyl-4-hydroxybenzoate decarboxylase
MASFATSSRTLRTLVVVAAALLLLTALGTGAGDLEPSRAASGALSAGDVVLLLRGDPAAR